MAVDIQRGFVQLMGFSFELSKSWCKVAFLSKSCLLIARGPASVIETFKTNFDDNSSYGLKNDSSFELSKSWCKVLFLSKLCLLIACGFQFLKSLEQIVAIH